MTASDAELAALAGTAKDPGAYAELVRRHQGAVRGMLRKLARDPDRADDLAQEAFLRGWRKVGAWKGSGSFRAWICAIAYREFLMAKRKDRSIARLAEAAAVEAEGETFTSPTGAERLDVDRALAALRPEERDAVVLAFAAGMSHSEIARALDKPLGTTKSLVARGREKMALALAATTNDRNIE